MKTPRCICVNEETRHEGNPTGHRVDCPRWGTTLPNTWRDRRPGSGYANPALLSSKNQAFETPDLILERVRHVGPIGFDPCTTADNPTGARMWVVPPFCGLTMEWPILRPGEVVYQNSPFGAHLSGPVRPGRAVKRSPFLGTGWAEKAASYPGEVIVLAPTRGAKWWHRLMRASAAACLLDRRLTFRNAPSCAPFDVTVFYRGRRPERFRDAFQDIGTIVRGF